MIHVVRECLKGIGLPLMIMAIMIPIAFLFLTSFTDLLLDGVNRDEIPEDMQKQFDSTLGILSAFPIIIGVILFLNMFFKSDITRIVKTANIEKRMEKLKKLGSDEFIKNTEAVLMDQSKRGNKLYTSKKIIEGRELKFLVYKDKSTDREYISFVTDDQYEADEAMASKFHLGVNEYNMLKLENES